MVTVDLDTRVEVVEETVRPQITSKFLCTPGCPTGGIAGLRVKMCVWLGVSRGLDLAFLNAD